MKRFKQSNIKPIPIYTLLSEVPSERISGSRSIIIIVYQYSIGEVEMIDNVNIEILEVLKEIKIAICILNAFVGGIIGILIMKE